MLIILPWFVVEASVSVTVALLHCIRRYSFNCVDCIVLHTTHPSSSSVLETICLLFDWHYHCWSRLNVALIDFDWGSVSVFSVHPRQLSHLGTACSVLYLCTVDHLSGCCTSLAFSYCSLIPRLQQILVQVSACVAMSRAPVVNRSQISSLVLSENIVLCRGSCSSTFQWQWSIKLADCVWLCLNRSFHLSPCVYLLNIGCQYCALSKVRSAITYKSVKVPVPDILTEWGDEKCWVDISSHLAGSRSASVCGNYLF